LTPDVSALVVQVSVGDDEAVRVWLVSLKSINSMTRTSPRAPLMLAAVDFGLLVAPGHPVAELVVPTYVGGVTPAGGVP
jgi:hypothetical protein